MEEETEVKLRNESLLYLRSELCIARFHSVIPTTSLINQILSNPSWTTTFSLPKSLWLPVFLHIRDIFFFKLAHSGKI
jgi:hypothetical protein